MHVEKVKLNVLMHPGNVQLVRCHRSKDMCLDLNDHRSRFGYVRHNQHLRLSGNTTPLELLPCPFPSLYLTRDAP